MEAKGAQSVREDKMFAGFLKDTLIIPLNYGLFNWRGDKKKARLDHSKRALFS